MNREQIILKHIDKSQKGIEIGPSHAPIAPKAQGYDVKIVDHLNKAELVKKYALHKIDTSQIEDVDYVSQGERLDELIPSGASFGWIIASHVIEHAPDFISFLQGCEALLKEDGVLSLAIPDKRYCFDRFRSLTGLSGVIDAYLQRRRLHTPGSVADYFINVVSMGGQIAWAAEERKELSQVHGTEDAARGIKLVAEQGMYLDIHAWCFTPTSFRLLIRDLNELGYLSLRELEVSSPGGFEFFVTLSRKGTLLGAPRVELLQQIEKEQAAVLGLSPGSA